MGPQPTQRRVKRGVSEEGVRRDRSLTGSVCVSVCPPGRLTYYGFWFAPEMELVMASIDHTQKHVTGAVELSLYKGNVTVVGRESPFSLYRWASSRATTASQQSS